jgi:hypothetical protein
MNRTLNFLILLTAAIFVNQAGISVFAEENSCRFIPVVKYDYLSLDSRVIHSPGAGLIIMSGDVTAAGFYTRHEFMETLSYDYPDVYHSLEFIVDGRIKTRHQYLGLFKSESDRPVSGGLHTFQAAAAYGYEMIKGDDFSLVLGGGLAVSDFGLETAGGSPWPVIPVPLVRMKYETALVNASLEFLTSPNIGITLFPENQLRFTGDFRFDQLRDSRDLLFECSAVYRFFSADHPLGDLAGISLGVKNNNYGFDLEDKDESLEIHYYSLFSSLDLTLLKITGGYAFEGREMYREEYKNDLGDGYFLTVQGMYQF